MTTFFSYPFTHLNGNSGRITLSTGPIILNTTEDKILLHISSTTGKYQFIGGRLDDTLNFRENTLLKAREIIGESKLTLSEDDPIVIEGTIERDGWEEKIILIHYRAFLENETDIGSAEWFTLKEVIILDAENKTSSENVRIIAEQLLKK